VFIVDTLENISESMQRLYRTDTGKR